MPPWNSRFSQRDFKVFCESASGSQPVLQFFSKLFRLFSCSCFQEFHFNKILAVLTIGVKARQQCYLLPVVSAWGHSFLNKCGCKFQCCQQDWSQVGITKIQFWGVKLTSFRFLSRHHYKTTEMLNTNIFVKHIVLWTVKLMKPAFQLIKLAISMLISILSIPSHPLQQSLLLPPMSHFILSLPPLCPWPQLSPLQPPLGLSTLSSLLVAIRLCPPWLIPRWARAGQAAWLDSG